MHTKAIPQMHQIKLSSREMEIAYYLAWGFSDKEIATKLCISHHTVRTHHANINTKTNSRNLADVARWYFQLQQGHSFGQRPSALRVMAVCLLLLLVGAAEFMHNEMIRTRTTSRIVKARRLKRNKNNVFII